MINFWRNSNVRTKDRKEAKKNDENKKKKKSSLECVVDVCNVLSRMLGAIIQNMV